MRTSPTRSRLMSQLVVAKAQVLVVAGDLAGKRAIPPYEDEKTLGRWARC